MRTKRFIFATTALLVLSGCMTTEARWSTDQVLQFKTDCSDPNQQAMLESQRLTRTDYIKNGIMMSSITGTIASMLDGTYNERVKIQQGARTTSQRMAEYFRDKQCRQEAFDKQYYR